MSSIPSSPSADAETIREVVRARYTEVVETRSSCCGPTTSCCAPEDAARQMGYSPDELALVPEGANLGLGCGNPQAIAELKPGETVLDLGSGAGFDCFLAARQVGPEGQVIGVDMTPAMVSRARQLAREHGYTNVAFRLGEIEHLPVADNSVDVILSNCVINLSPDKPQVFREAFRVLRPGGRLAISDIVTSAPLPPHIREDLALYAECVGGAASVDELTQMLAEAGFVAIRIEPKDESRAFIREWSPEHGLDAYIVSATIRAVKPAG